jgi:hypothetical protein
MWIQKERNLKMVDFAHRRIADRFTEVYCELLVAMKRGNATAAQRSTYEMEDQRAKEKLPDDLYNAARTKAEADAERVLADQAKTA